MTSRAQKRIQQLLADRYLGRAGIHGLGLVGAGRTVRVYCVPGSSAERETILGRLRQDAKPLEVEIVFGPPPRIG